MRATNRFPWLYLLLAYGWAWLGWIPVALSRRDYQDSPLLLSAIMLGVFGPGMAGIVLTYRNGKPEERRVQLRRWQAT